MGDFPKLTDLQFSQPIVNPDGTASDYFLRYLYDRSGFFSEAEQEFATLLARQIVAGTGLTGGGDLSADVTLALADTPVTPGTYTNANITVDQQGRITSAADGPSSSLDVRDEGVSLVNPASALNFIGAGVTVTDAGGGVANITIPGGGGGGGGGSQIDYQRAQVGFANAVTTTQGATVGQVIDSITRAFNIYAVHAFINAPAAGATYKAVVAKLDASNTITSLAISTEVYAPGSAGDNMMRLALAAPFSVAVGDTIFVGTVRTDSTASATNGTRAGNNVSDRNFIAAGSTQGRYYTLASNPPVVGNTFSFTASTYRFAVGFEFSYNTTL